MKRAYITVIIVLMAALAFAPHAFAQAEKEGVSRKVLRPARPVQPEGSEPRQVKPSRSFPVRIEPNLERIEEIAFARVGESYSFDFIAKGGLGYGFIWDHSVLPIGLVMRMDPRIEGKIFIEGEPAKAGEFQIKIMAKDVSDPSLVGTYTYTLQVAPPLME